MSYTFKNFEQDLINKPYLVKSVLVFIKQIMGANIKKFAVGKSQTEFANVVVLVLQSNLSEKMTKFLAYNLYTYIQKNSQHVIKKINKLTEEKNNKKIIKTLLMLLQKGTLSTTQKNKGKKFSFWKNRIQTISMKKKVIGNRVKTIMYSGPRVVRKMFQEETFTSASAPIKKNKTILGTSSPLKDKELESLRIQTLVSFNSKKSLLKWVSIPNEKQLLRLRSIDFFKILKSISLITKLSKEQKTFISFLKNTLMIRSKLLFQDQIIINIINEGTKSYNHTLNRLSNICTKRNINKKIRDYLHENTEKRLKNFSNIYRQELGRISTVADLEKLVKKYPLMSTTIIKKYKELQIIKSIKDIFYAYNKTPKKLNSIMNRYLGSHAEANIKTKLMNILVTSSADMEIFQKVQRERNIFNCIKVLEKNKNNAIANKILTIIVSFMRPESSKNFSNFKAGLNFVSSPLAKKIEVLMRSYLALELNKNIKPIFIEQGVPFDRLNSLVKILKLPKYRYADMSVFQMDPISLADKIVNIKGTQQQLKRYIEHSFPSPQYPKKFRLLLEQAKITESSLEEKSITNFYRALDVLEKKVKKRELLLIKHEIINLFKSYGNINFSDSSKQFINGYSISRTIEDYYRNPRRNDIQLSQDISIKVRNKVKSMIDNERKRQLQKLASKK